MSASASASVPFLHLGPSCVVCSEALLTGPHPIRLGAGCIVHPRARIDASLGPVTIGANNVLEEWSTVRATDAHGLTLGDCNVMRVGACVEAAIGSGNVVECRAHITQGGSLGDGCVVGASLRVDWSVASSLVLYACGSSGGVSSRRRDGQLAANLEEVKAKEALRDMLAKTHRLVH